MSFQQPRKSHQMIVDNSRVIVTVRREVGSGPEEFQMKNIQKAIWCPKESQPKCDQTHNLGILSL